MLKTVCKGLTFIGASALACACFTAPARTSGPASARNVQLVLVAQDCNDSHRSLDYAGSEVVQMRMKVALTNSSREVVSFNPDQLRLIAPDGLVPRPVGSDAPITVPPGESRTSAVRFMTRGGMRCDTELKLDPAGSIVMGATPVALPDIAFVAHRGG